MTNIDHQDSLEAFGKYRDLDYERWLDSLADQHAEDEYWELRNQELESRHTDCGRPKGSPYEGQD